MFDKSFLMPHFDPGDDRDDHSNNFWFTQTVKSIYDNSALAISGPFKKLDQESVNVENVETLYWHWKFFP